MSTDAIAPPSKHRGLSRTHRPGPAASRLPLQVVLDRFSDRLVELESRIGLDASREPGSVNDRVLTELLRACPTEIFLPREAGGRGGDPDEELALIRRTAYHSLGLALGVGINGFLFAEPLARFASPTVAARVWPHLLAGHFGGFMLTEPDAGTDALNIATTLSTEGGELRVRGVKHWSGFTGRARFWLVAARRKEGAALARDVSLVLVDRANAGSGVEVEEHYSALGLAPIPYGRTRMDARAAADHELVPASTGVRMLSELLHRSRLSVAAFACGVHDRLETELIAHVSSRRVGGQPLSSRANVVAQVDQLRHARRVCEGLLSWSAGLMCDPAGLAHRGLEAAVVKSVASELMHESSSRALQLFGASGYRYDAPVGRAFVDSRAFQIFEGPNDVLFDQIALGLIRARARADSGESWWARSLAEAEDAVGDQIDADSHQELRVRAGQLAAHWVAAQHSYGGER